VTLFTIAMNNIADMVVLTQSLCMSVTSLSFVGPVL
jgi:hypothetical protein